MRLSNYELCLRNLAGHYGRSRLGYMSPEEAVAKLKEMSGQDFGLDIEKWRAWGKENPSISTIGGKKPG